MSIRAVPRRVATGAVAAAITGAMFVWSFATPAFAETFNSGVEVLQSATPTGTYSLGAPFSSGQAIDVQVPANSVLQPLHNVNILECSDPGGLPANDPTSIADCDGETIQGPTVSVNADGSVSFDGYVVYALPDSISLDESPTQTPVCNLSNPCVLYIGQSQNDFTQPHVFSEPFVVAPNASDDGANPGDGGTSTLVAGVTFTATVTVTNSPPAGATAIKAKLSGQMVDGRTAPKPSGITTITPNNNGTVTLSGTPTIGKSGSYPLVISEEFQSGHTDTTFTSDVTLEVVQPATLKTPAVKEAKVGHNFDMKLQTNKGANPTPSFTETGALPAGVALVDNGNGTAAFTGVPTAAGSFPITVSEWNGVGAIASFSFTLTVAAS